MLLLVAPKGSPTLTRDEGGTAVVIGESEDITCDLTTLDHKGKPPSTSVTWRKLNNASFIVNHDAYYTLHPVDVRDSGAYVCQAYNDYGHSNFSNPIHVLVEGKGGTYYMMKITSNTVSF